MKDFPRVANNRRYKPKAHFQTLERGLNKRLVAPARPLSEITHLSELMEMHILLISFTLSWRRLRGLANLAIHKAPRNHRPLRDVPARSRSETLDNSSALHNIKITTSHRSQVRIPGTNQSTTEFSTNHHLTLITGSNRRHQSRLLRIIQLTEITASNPRHKSKRLGVLSQFTCSTAHRFESQAQIKAPQTSLQINSSQDRIPGTNQTTSRLFLIHQLIISELFPIHTAHTDHRFES